MSESISPIQHLSNAFADTVEKIGRSVVRVEARRRGNASGISWSKDGIVITAHHAVQRDTNIRIGLADGSVVDAELVGRDPATDVAVLKATEGQHEPAEWEPADGIRVGHLVLSVGRHDEHPQASLGIVSKMGDAWRTSAGGKVDTYVQTDIAVYPGYSGSALVNDRGRIVGMNSSWLMRRLPLSLPLSTLQHVVEQLLQHGRMRRGYLGIGAYPVKLHRNVADELGQRSGLLIISIEPDSPADQAGLLLGDLLVDFNGEQLRHVDDLLSLLAGDQIGNAASIRLVRAGAVKEMKVTLGERT